MPSRPASEVLAHDENANELITGEAVSLDLRPASFVLRAAGAIIDYLVYLGGFFLFILLVTSVFTVDAAVLQAIMISALVIAIVVIPTAVETITQGKSLGRLAVGTRIVRSSNGEQQERHVVEADVVIAGQVIRTEFTLADREAMNFPVLLGRRLLRGNFLVDVAKRRRVADTAAEEEE